MDPQNPVRMMVFSSLMAVLISIGAYISIPIGPVPIVMQNLFVLLAGLLLGSRWATASVSVYLVAGAFGLPVFAGGKGGIGILFGPTGGYLFGFLLAAWLVGWVSEKSHHSRGAEIFGLISASLLIYLVGVPWLKFITGMPFNKAFALGVIPFLLGDSLKIVIAISIAKSLRPLIKGDTLRKQVQKCTQR